MPDTIRHTFEEVPLVTENGFAAFLVTVDAEISFWADGSWTVVGIMSEASKTLDARANQFLRKWVYLDVGHPIYSALLHEIEHGSKREEANEVVLQELRDRFRSRNDDYRREREGV